MPSSVPTLVRFRLLAAISFVLPVLSSHAAGVDFAQTADAPTAYEVLERYGFPRGILPEGVRSYLLGKDGTFDVYVGGYGDCNFAVTAGYTLHYRRKITGRLDVNGPIRAIRELKGVWVRRRLFVWLPIGEVVMGDAELSFHVGPLSASFPFSDFNESPHCRRTLDRAAVATVLLGSKAA